MAVDHGLIPTTTDTESGAGEGSGGQAAAPIRERGVTPTVNSGGGGVELLVF